MPLNLWVLNLARPMLLAAAFAFLSTSASAAEVAFLIVKDEKGQIVQLEPGGVFYHVAIRYREQWLHAHTYAGVQLVDSLADYGDEFIYLSNDSVPEPRASEVAQWVGKPFDHKLRWDTVGATYCTRLIADLLHIDPRPMYFAAQHWKSNYQSPRGALGLSPDELFEALINRGFRRVRSCEDYLEEWPPPYERKKR